jgi:predicted  nucleic acid-binding Zn-ribbon protein
MPHQCLKCGQIFEEGSSQLLKGCPECGGHRFFFTKLPLDEQQRSKISAEVNEDMTEKIMDLLMEKTEGSQKTTGKWVTIKPKEVRKMLQQNMTPETIEKPPKEVTPEPPVITDDEREQTIKKIEEELEVSDSPETIDIERPGKYSIDLKGLLEQEPIIIQKDGSYTIHLPSVFKMIDQKKK